MTPPTPNPTPGISPEDSCPICGADLDLRGFHANTGEVHCDQAVYDAIDGREQYRRDYEDYADYGEQLEDGFRMLEDF